MINVFLVRPPTMIFTVIFSGCDGIRSRLGYNVHSLVIS